MISAQRFVKEWRLAHESVTNESLARMLVEYAEQFIAEARADERDQMRKELWPMLLAAAVDERAALRARVEALPPLQMRRPDDVYAAYVLRADVLALLTGASDE